MNMQVRNEHLASAAAIKNVDASDPVFSVIDLHRSANRVFADFPHQKSEFDDGRRDGSGAFQETPECAAMDTKEESLCEAEREVASDLAEILPTTPEGAFAKLDYIVSEHVRGNRLYTEGELISVMRSILESGVLTGESMRRQKRRSVRAKSMEQCPVHVLAKELGRLTEKYNELDKEQSCSNGTIDNDRLKMIVHDRMEAIYDEVSYLQSTSIVGAAFQAMIVKSHLDVLTDTDGDKQRVMQARLDRLLYLAVKNLISVSDIRRAQAYLMDEHMSPFAFL